MRKQTARRVLPALLASALLAAMPAPPGRGCDWVLVLDDAARGFPAPGLQPLAALRDSSNGRD